MRIEAFEHWIQDNIKIKNYANSILIKMFKLNIELQ